MAGTVASSVVQDGDCSAESLQVYEEEWKRSIGTIYPDITI